MSRSWFTRSKNLTGSELTKPTTQKHALSRRAKLLWIAFGISSGIIITGLAVGLGVGLTRHKNDEDNAGSASNTPSPSLGNITFATQGNFWRPIAGTPWQIVLEYALNDTSINVPIYDIDLFTNDVSTIANLHAMNRSVICYFSAGSYEDFRPDSNNFTKDDYANPLKGWTGEWWLNTNSSNVRNIMSARIALAASKGCDGVDPDNIDGYDPSNNIGIDLTEDTAVNYLTFLAIEAHSRNMSIGLKNGGAIVDRVLDMLQWEVNEQCGPFNECGDFRPFVDAGKPVFRIEYPDSAPDVSKKTLDGICNNTAAAGFSTVVKKMSLDDWVGYC